MDADKVVNQSNSEQINVADAKRGKTCEWATIGFGFTSDWLTKKNKKQKKNESGSTLFSQSRSAVIQNQSKGE